MFESSIAFNLGKNKKDENFIVFWEKDFFLCFAVYLSIDSEKIKIIIENLKNKINRILVSRNKLFNSLLEFDDFISSFIFENNFSSYFSLSSGYLKDNVLFLKTINQGKIFIKRENKFGLILQGNKIASGIVKNKDLFIFTIKNFSIFLEKKEKINEYFSDEDPKKIVEKILFIDKANEDNPFLLVRFNEKNIFENLKKENKNEFLKNNFFDLLKSYFFLLKKSRKTFTLIISFLLFLLLIWSATGAVKRRKIMFFNNKEKEVYEVILQKLQMAEEVAFLNSERSLILINESKKELDYLKDEAKKSKIESKKLKEIENMINNTEQKIFKRQKADKEEFFDFSVEDKRIFIERIYLKDDILYVLDKRNGVIYIFSLEKKSLDKVKGDEIKNGLFLAGEKEKIFFYTKERGIYQIDNLEKPKKVIEKDKDWGEIIDMAVYNGNLYLLDKENDEIWKYFSSGDGFSEKISYFSKKQAIDLSAIKSFSIDGSIYLLSERNVYKYNSGIRQSFSFDFPLNNFSFSQIFTDNRTEKIYILDKKNSSIYIFGKNGDYIEQVNLDIFSKVNDFFVYQDKIYVLLKNKIYKIIN